MVTIIREIPGAQWTVRSKHVGALEWTEGVMLAGGKPLPLPKHLPAIGDLFYRTLRKLGYRKNGSGDYQ